MTHSCWTNFEMQFDANATIIERLGEYQPGPYTQAPGPCHTYRENRVIARHDGPSVLGSIHAAGPRVSEGFRRGIHRRDAHGVPHIAAATQDDLFIAQGYVTAQDRLWQMDTYRRSANGELAEVLGSRLVPVDRVKRVMGFHKAAERIYVFVNGPTGIDNPFRQGLDSALSDNGTHGPLNILGGIPTINLDYSPLWRLFPVRWTAAAIEKGYRTKMTDAIAIEDAGERGIVESIAGWKPKAVGFIVNCPVVYRIN